MPIRNPFRRTGPAEVVEDAQRDAADNGFRDTTLLGAKPVLVKDSAEYKLSGETPTACAECASPCLIVH